MTLDVGLGALFATGVVLGLVGAATASSVVGAIAVPLAGLVISITALAQRSIENEAIFDDTMCMLQGVYDDLAFKNAYNATSHVLNLWDKPLKKCDGTLVTDSDGKVKKVGRLAPIQSLNLKDNTVTYGSINVPGFYGGGGVLNLYWFVAPNIAHSSLVDLLSRSKVIEQLAAL